jgi:tetratricopeptide (TPR) repeat protein
MRVDIIDTMPALLRLEDNWNAVYDSDPDARFFLSWKWLSGWIEQIGGPWLILAARAHQNDSAPYVAFLPLRIQTKVENGRIHNELNMAGNFTADYTGLLCLPDAESRAIPAFARCIRTMNWARLNLENIHMSEKRLNLLLAFFSKSDFETEEISRIGKIDGIDINVCPFAALPADWESYLQTLTANTRQKVRRLLRILDTADGLHITHATDETIDRDLDTMLRFWETKWTPRKGDTTKSIAKSNRTMLTRSFRAGFLFLPTLWKDDRPLAALATLVDHNKRSFLFYMTGRDGTFDELPAGLLLHAYSIRHAIDSGMAEYDFLRGNEAYKYSFGTDERRIRFVSVKTRSGLNLGSTIDRRTISDVLQAATELHRTGRLSDAEHGYRQVLRVSRRNADAIHRLGQLYAAKGDFIAAKDQFLTLTKIRPDAYKSWIYLAQSCVALEQYSEATKAYCEAIRLKPDAVEVFNGLAAILAKLNRVDELNEALLSAITRSEIPPPKIPYRRLMKENLWRQSSGAMVTAAHIHQGAKHHHRQ